MHRKSPKLSITIPARLLEEVSKMAEKENRTLSNMIAHLTEMGITIQHTHDQIINKQYKIAEPETDYKTNPDKPDGQTT